LNQNILAKDLPANIELGDFLAISGFRDGDGKIHATHIAATKSSNVLMRGQLDRSKNRLSMHGFDLAFPGQPQTGNNDLKIEGTLAEGKLNVARAFPDKVALFKVVSTWVVQGFPASYDSAWKDNEDLKKISDQSEPVIFRVKYVNENTPAKILLLPDNLPKGANVSIGQKHSGFGNESSPGHGGKSSGGGNESSPGHGGESSGDRGKNSGGGYKP